MKKFLILLSALGLSVIMTACTFQPAESFDPQATDTLVDTQPANTVTSSSVITPTVETSVPSPTTSDETPAPSVDDNESRTIICHITSINPDGDIFQVSLSEVNLNDLGEGDFEVQELGNTFTYPTAKDSCTIYVASSDNPWMTVSGTMDQLIATVSSNDVYSVEVNNGEITVIIYQYIVQ